MLVRRVLATLSKQPHKPYINSCEVLSHVRAMASAGGTKKVIAVAQMTSTNNKAENFAVCKTLVETAKSRNAVMLFLPEACDYVGESIPEMLSMAETLDGPLVRQFCDLARQTGMWLSLGGIHRKMPNDKLANCHVLIDDEGRVAATYHKVHLFDAEVPERGIRLKESSYVEPGREVVPPVRTPAGDVGLMICYDMRFPEVSTALRMMGADILTFPSAFTFATGSAHWEVLLRARAIENQCYVVAAAQTGAHSKKRSSWGHAMIVDPWGIVVAQCSEGTGVATAELDPSLLAGVRAGMPVLQHRRHDLYPRLATSAPPPTALGEEEEGASSYRFGQVSVPAGAVFYRTPLSIAFTNKKCAVHGHVLVAPLRCVPHMKQLAAEEVADLFRAAQRVGQVLERVHGTSDFSFVVQDGRDAGQTIQHVHVHVLPRRPGDFPVNDDVYRELERSVRGEDDDRGTWRSEEEMVAEASQLREHF
ncbi:deaminated glutathione amidase isoform X2 [Bacillus rossius redtenbacheri]|uniref:deaminated glutathione amidase isoform X2 n=1 Tax=Bacillus rossius redtenbacheri TaxID=93214 RepID=UPI002FDDAD11